MHISRSAHRVAASIVGVLLITAGSDVFPANAPVTTPNAPSKEMREKAATLHEQMAACLRSDKSITECRAEMVKNCQSMMGSQGCSMMGMGGGMMSRGRGMHNRRMPSSPSSSGTPK